MKRRNFMIMGGMVISANLCGAITQLLQPPDHVSPTQTLVPTVKLPGTNTPVPTKTPPTQAPVPAPTQTAAQPTATTLPTAEATAENPFAEMFLDDFTSPVDTRTVLADQAQQVAFGEHGLHVQGIAPGDGDPAVFDNRAIQPENGQSAGARFRVAPWKALGRLGLITPDGSGLACIRRSTAEGEGGILDCGAQSAAALNLYSGCWYDLLLFHENERAAFAINDGAGLELALIGEEDGANPRYIGYSAPASTDQDADIGMWYARGPRYFPPVLADDATPQNDYEAETGTNAAWVEAQINRVDGCAGFRFRSIDNDHEYRVYLDGTAFKVDLVIKGRASKISSYEMADSPEGKLAIHFNELTLTIYYNGVVVGMPNRKIGAPELINATKIGIFSTHPDNIFTNFKVYAVRLDAPEPIREHLLESRAVLCLGDSLTAADKAFGYQNRLRKQLGEGWVTVDAGVVGQSTYQMFKRLPTHLEHYHPEVVIILGGTNDLILGLSAETVMGNLQVTYNAARKAGARVAAVTIPPPGNYERWDPDKQAALEKVNAWIMGGAGNVNYRVNAYHVLAEKKADYLASQYDSGDHVHLNGAGYNALANTIFTNVHW